MAEVKTEQEPSIEEILESIRQIISEDDSTEQPAAAPPKAVAPAAPQPQPAAPKPVVSAPFDPGVLDLTDKVEADPVFAVAPEPAAPRREVFAQDNSDHLISDTTADAASAAMARLLSGNVAVEREVSGRVGKVTLEDMARDLMYPLIKSWLDQNLPSLIEKMVQKEIEKISRRAADK